MVDPPMPRDQFLPGQAWRVCRPAWPTGQVVIEDMNGRGSFMAKLCPNVASLNKIGFALIDWGLAMRARRTCRREPCLAGSGG